MSLVKMLIKMEDKLREIKTTKYTCISFNTEK